MSEPIQIIVGANQPSEIWAGINKDEATVARFEMLMQAFEYILILSVVNTLLIAILLLKTGAGEEND